jgi:hypothetical protein
VWGERVFKQIPEKFKKEGGREGLRDLPWKILMCRFNEPERIYQASGVEVTGR